MIGVLVSGAGTNLQALIDARPARLSAVASNRRDAYALVRARAAGIPVATFSLDCHPDREERDLVMATWLERHGVELVVSPVTCTCSRRPFLAAFPDRDRQRPPLAPARLPGHPRDRGRARRRRRDDRGDGAPGRRGDRHRRRSCARSRCRSRRATTLEERIHALEHRLLPAVVARARCAPRCRRRESAHLGLRQARRRRLRRRARRARASSSSPRAAPRLPRGAAASR